MGFIDDNKNFILQNLIIGMNSLSNSDKIIKYELIKKETRKRLSNSYINSSDKLSFYKEAFSELSLYETDYLMLNLFFEKDVNVWFTILSRNHFKSLNFTSEYHLSKIFYNYMVEHSEEDNTKEFIKKEFIELTNINENVWNNLAGHKTFIQAYTNWMVESLGNSTIDETLFFSYQMLCKLWDISGFNSEDFNRQSGFLYYYTYINIEKVINSGEKIDLLRLTNLFKGLANELFNNKKLYFPFIDLDDNNYSTFHLLQRDKFIKMIELSETYCTSYIDKSFIFLFNLIDKHSNPIVINKLQEEIISKLENFNSPSSGEINEIIGLGNFNEMNKFKKAFLRKIYCFEIIL